MKVTRRGDRNARRGGSPPARLGSGFQALYRCASLGVATLSPKGRFLTSNAALRRMLGYDARELAALDFDDITHPEDVGACRVLFDKLQRGGIDHFEMEKRYVRGDGRLLWALVIVAAVRERGKLHHTVGVAVDITKRKKAEELLRGSEARYRSLYRTTQKSVALLNQFLAMVSQELKSPLSLLQLRIELVSRAIDEARLPAPLVRKLKSLMEGSLPDVARFARLVDNLVDLSLIAAGPLPLQPERMRLARSVRTALADVKSEPERLGFKPLLDLDEGVEGRWDQLRVEQVLRALFSNAAKFGGGGPVKVALRRRGGRARVSVEDHGIGMSREDQSRLFDRLGRPLSEGCAGGAGLSLYVARRIALAHGGSLSVKSERGRGSTFTFELPLGRSGGSAPAG